MFANGHIAYALLVEPTVVIVHGPVFSPLNPSSKTTSGALDRDGHPGLERTRPPIILGVVVYIFWVPTICFVSPGRAPLPQVSGPGLGPPLPNIVCVGRKGFGPVAGQMILQQGESLFVHVHWDPKDIHHHRVWA